MKVPKPLDGADDVLFCMDPTQNMLHLLALASYTCTRAKIVGAVPPSNFCCVRVPQKAAGATSPAQLVMYAVDMFNWCEAPHVNETLLSLMHKTSTANGAVPPGESSKPSG